MVILNFLISIAGATMLLLFAVRLVRTGIERSYGASFQRLLTGQSNPVQASFVGLALAVVLQSSAAVALLTTGFAASGLLAFGTGLAIVLGGDLGSALIIQLLSFDLAWLVPILLAIGGWLFVKTEKKKLRQAGRIIMGIALILISLQFLREAMDPIRGSAFLPAVSEYLARDYITAFLVGAALAFLMHSSVAAILMCVTLVEVGALPFAAGLSLVLGANLGSAFIPVWLTRGMALPARRIVFANLALRGIWAIVSLFAANLILQDRLLAAEFGSQMLINAHIAFNASMLVLALPFCNMLRVPFEKLWPGQTDPSDILNLLRPESALEPENFGTPTQAISSLKRELLRMNELLEAMFRPVMTLYRSGEKSQHVAVRSLDREVNACLTRVRDFVASLPIEVMAKEDGRVARDMLEYAIRLEKAGDVVAERLAILAGDLRKENGTFSKDGWQELESMHESILANMKLASNVLISDDLESARLLNMEKTEMKRAERNSRKRHFHRLQSGEVQSFATSDIHLETLRAFRDFNSDIAAVATPILYANGQLLETRLIEELPTLQED
ncbi:Na/Pi cotransporter [Sulfitobacter sp. SK012]|uniref:Na/Pi cotransporter family protein n=1 Tax=Sulfitobacter sp. SK012 TaxID=1389005 RepID=UPI000E0B44B1|nr:Na/Pi cotransporter family protein [Sulfitobacter sp. SK012]AXI45629.1 Na/Pi cotransporter [Sulfitobacter sp. SK012]